MEKLYAQDVEDLKSQLESSSTLVGNIHDSCYSPHPPELMKIRVEEKLQKILK